MKRGSFPGHRYVSKLDGNSRESWTRFTCGYCGATVSGAVLARYRESEDFDVAWLQCPDCANGSVRGPEGAVHPPPKFGPAIEGLPADVEVAYDEARDCMGIQAYTACELLCRKILMHVAVEKGAVEGESFASYVSHLATAGYVTPPMKDWVDQIRTIGNAATHELDPPVKERAESTLMFTAELLRLVYEMDNYTKKYTFRAESD